MRKISRAQEQHGGLNFRNAHDESVRNITQQHSITKMSTKITNDCVFCGRENGHWDQGYGRTAVNRFDPQTGEGLNSRPPFEIYQKNFGDDGLPTNVDRPGVGSRTERKQFSQTLSSKNLEDLVDKHNKSCTIGCTSDCGLEKMFRLAEDNLETYSLEDIEKSINKGLPLRLKQDHLLESLADRNSSHQNLHDKSPAPYLFYTNNGVPSGLPPGMTPEIAKERLTRGGCIICGSTINKGEPSASWIRVTRSPETILPDHDHNKKLRQLSWFSSRPKLGLSDEDYKKFNDRYIKYQQSAAQKWRYNPSREIRRTKQNGRLLGDVEIQRETDSLPLNGGVGGFRTDDEDRFIGVARFPAHKGGCFNTWYTHCPGVQGKPMSDFEFGTGGGQYFIPESPKAN